MSQAKMIQFPKKHRKKDNLERLLTFTTSDSEEFYIKAKYKIIITELTKTILGYYSKLSENNRNVDKDQNGREM